MPQIEVSFNIDANGILQVSAKDKGTGKEQTIKIESSGGLTKEEIDRMQRDAQANAAQDKRRRELAEARNTAEQRVYQLEKLLNEIQDRLSEADIAVVRSAIDKVNQVKNGDDPSAIQRAIDDLQRASPGDEPAFLRTFGNSRKTFCSERTVELVRWESAYWRGGHRCRIRGEAVIRRAGRPRRNQPDRRQLRV